MVNWDAVGAIAELGGAAAVMASLVYLANQIRHSSRSVEAATNHAIARGRNELNIAIAANPELSEILVRGGRDYASLQPGERQRYDLVVISSLNIIEDAYVQYSKGLVSRESWEENLSVLSRQFAQPGAREWWRDRAESFVMSSAFREEIDAVIRDQPAKPTR